MAGVQNLSQEISVVYVKTVKGSMALELTHGLGPLWVIFMNKLVKPPYDLLEIPYTC